MKNIKITVVTVCFNVEKILDKTIKSVINQTYNNLEYIIIDGESTDNTLDVINRYKGIPYLRIISEPDKGIYDAMNKAIKFATGEYIIFMNSGDGFLDNDVLQNFYNQIGREEFGIYYGNILTTIDNKIIEKKMFNEVIISTYHLLKGDSICHQAMFTKTKLLKENEFDLTYQICADKDFIIKSYKQKVKFKYINFDICCYDITGISSIKRNELEVEAKDIMYKYFPIKASIIYCLKKIKRKLYNFDM